MRLGSTALATERVERMLAAILAADVAGYSPLIGVDEGGTLQGFKAIRAECYTAYGANRSMARGDAERQLRRGCDRQLPERGQPAARQQKVPAESEKYVLDTEAHEIFLLSWYRTVPYRSYVKGWNISPSHYLNQDLTTTWLDK
jgi:hypothetical protein